MEKKITSVIFDLNGVLVDSLGLQFESWKRMFDEYGIPFDEHIYTEKANGVSRELALKNILGEDFDPEQLGIMFDRKDYYFQESVKTLSPDDPRILPLPGVEEFVVKLNAHNVPIAVASSSRNVAMLLQSSGFDAYFDVIVSANDYSKRKPDPDIYEVTCLQLGVSPENTLLIEDSCKGLRAAQGIGMATVGVTSSRDVCEGQADLVIDRMTEYPKILEMFFPELS